MSDAEPRNPFTRRGFVLGGIVVACLTAAAIVLAFTSGHSDNTAVPTATPALTATAPADPAAASVCGLAGYDTTNTLTAAPETQWDIVGTMAAPGSTMIGPGVTDTDGFRSCYAHTIDGALFAVANVWAMGSNARLGDELIDKLTVPGPGRDAALAKNLPPSNTGISAQIAGFKTLSYSADRATIDIAFQLNNGTLASVATDMSWSGGDWKVELTDTGDSPYNPVMLQSLGGYVAWAGVK